MHDSYDKLGRAVVELTGFINDPRQDWRMMAEAGLDLDPAFLPVLVRLGMGGPAGVVELSGRVGRDHSTVSRQLTRLEAEGLVERFASEGDARVKAARVTAKGLKAVAALSAARRRLLEGALVAWTPEECDSLARLLERFAQALKSAPNLP